VIRAVSRKSKAARQIIFLPRWRTCSTFVLVRLPEGETAELAGSVETVPATAPRDRSVDAWGAARAPKTKREEPTVDLLNRGASVAGSELRFNAVRSLICRRGDQKFFSADISSQPLENARLSVKDGRKWKAFWAFVGVENVFGIDARPVLEIRATASRPRPSGRVAAAGGKRSRVAGKRRRNPLESLDSRWKTVWSRKPRTPNMLHLDRPRGRGLVAALHSPSEDGRPSGRPMERGRCGQRPRLQDL
jgi:hypothetical protein